MKGETNGSSVLPWCSVGEQAAILHMAGVVQVRPVALCCLYSTSSLLYYQIKGQNVQRIFKKKKKERKKKKNRADHTSSLVFYQRLKKKKNRKPKIT